MYTQLCYSRVKRNLHYQNRANYLSAPIQTFVTIAKHAVHHAFVDFAEDPNDCCNLPGPNSYQKNGDSYLGE